jgi:hypothetical protein
MVIRQFVQWRLLPTILTLIAVTGINMLPRKFDAPGLDANKFEESHHCRQPNGETDTMNLSAIFLYNFNFARE